MTNLRHLLVDTLPASLALGGALIGFAFGAVAQRTSFCAMGAISDAMTFSDARRLRAWLLAVAVAIVGVHGLAAVGAVDLSRSVYLAPRLNWAGHLAGGLMFGFGMVMAGGCASRNVIRAGTGDLRSGLMLLVIGLFAYMTTGGILGPARAELETATSIALTTPSQGLSDVATAFAGAAAVGQTWLTPLFSAALILAFCFSSRKFRSSRAHVLSGLAVGAIVVAGWALTGLAFDEMADRVQPPVSLTFVKPAGDAIEWLERYTALGAPTFGVATVFGALFGAFTAGWAGGNLRLATFADAPDTLRHLGGAALMGSGGIMALGCTIGQGISGLSTLAIGSILSFVSIVGGAVLGLKALERWVA